MPSHTFPVEVMPEETLFALRETGLLVPSNSGPGLRVIDCGDRRPLTSETVAAREKMYGQHLHSGRYFGGAAGLSATAILAAAVSAGDNMMHAHISSGKSLAFADFTADVSTRAHGAVNPIDIHNHSSSEAEGNPLDLDTEKTRVPGFDCAFAANLGTIAQIGASESVLEEATFILKQTGEKLPIMDVARQATAIGSVLPPSFFFSRKALQSIHRNPEYRTPFAVLDGKAEPTGSVRVIYDLAGYRSDATAFHQSGRPWYHHDRTLGQNLLPQLLPEFRLDESVTAASALLVGVATRQALSRMKQHELPAVIIPPEFADAA